jgi:hypothetical protein
VLISKATGQNSFQLHAHTKTMFFPKEFDAKVEFIVDAQGKVSQIVLHQGGRDTPAKRID